MQFFISPTKFVPPLSRPFIIKRKRLISSLTRNFHKKLIIICAGAGYGKTTLLGQFLKHITSPKIFFKIDEEDNEPIFFLFSLIAGIQKHHPGIGKNARKILERTENPHFSINSAVKSLLNDLLWTIKDDFYLFFDEFEHISEESGTNKVIDTLLSQSTSKIHFVLSSRYLPFLSSIPKLRLDENLYLLEEQALISTQEEIQELFKKKHKYSLKKSETETLLNYTKGWIAGIQMVIHTLDEDKSLEGIFEKFLGSNEELTRYFLSQVYKRESSKIKRFLVTSSIFRELNAEMCNAVLGIKDVEEILKYLIEHHIFVSSIDYEKRIFRYHPLFQKFLMSQLNKEKKEVLHNLAGKYFLSLKDYPQALYHFTEIKAYDLIVSTLKQYVPQLFQKGRYVFLKKYLDKIPQQILRDTPFLLFYKVKMAWLERRYAEVEKDIIICENRFKKERDWNKVYETKIYLMTTKHKNGDTETALSIAKNVLNRISKEDKFPVEVELFFLNELACIYSEIYQMQKAEKTWKRAMELLQKVNVPKWECIIKGNLAILSAQKGNLQDAYETWLALWERYRFQSPLYIFNICENLTFCEIILKKFHDAQFHAEWLLEYSKKFHNDFFAIRAYSFLSQIATFLEHPKRAKEFLEIALNLANSTESKEALCSVYESLLEHHLHYKRYEIAQKYLRILRDEKCFTLIEPRYTFFKGKISLGMGMLDASYKFFKNSLKIAIEVKDNFAIARNLWYLALLSYKMNREEESLNFAKEAIELIYNKQYYFLFSFDKDELCFIKFLFSSQKIEHPLLMSILEKTSEGKKFLEKKETHKKVELIQSPVPSIFIQFFGNFEIYLQGKKIEIKWHSSKILSLFAYLCARPNFHSVDLLIENFWPDVHIERAKTSLWTALSYLRKHLSPYIQGKIIENEKKNYRLNPEISIKRDTEEFENLYKNGRSLENTGDIEKSIEKYEQTINLYRDDFLKNLYDRWTDEERGYYRRVYLKTLRSLGNLYKEIGDFISAKDYYSRYISNEPYEEKAYCELFEILSDLKDQKTIKELYTSLCGHLNEISLTPSSLTKEIYNKSLSRL